MNTIANPTARHIPGEPALWLFILGDMMLYAILFLIFAHARAWNVALFTQSQMALSPGLGVVNTLILLTSSWFVAQGIRASRRGGYTAPRWFSLALGCGAAFGVSKCIEYTLMIDAGIVLTSNDFFMYYYLLTGFHLLHVLIGMAVLWFMHRAASLPKQAAKGIAFLECGATFWHLVDLLWILIFTLLYLVH